MSERLVYRVQGHAGCHLSNHGDGAALAVATVRQALDDDGLVAGSLVAITRPAPDVIIVVAKQVTAKPTD